MKLLVVEDDQALSRLLVKGLGKLGYAVDCAFDGEEALSLFEVNEYDLLILDLNLPKLDGLEVLRRVRKADRDFRVLILSARSSVEERVAGLDLGASDYLSKPFDLRELEARIRGLLRREFTQRDVTLSLGGLRADTAQRVAFWADKPIPLTKKEYGILEYLLHDGGTVSAETLIEHVWDSETDLFSNTLKFHISSLRKKLEAATGGGVEIVTLRGQGYRLALGEENI